MLLEALRRDLSFIVSSVCTIILMNFTFGHYILFPYSIFSTWVHEICHGMAAVMMGETVNKLEIFVDGSGLTTVTASIDSRTGFIASAGYPGTAVAGCILLLVRKQKYGPQIGRAILGLAMVLSCILYVRDMFGLIVLTGEGIYFLLSTFMLPLSLQEYEYTLLAMIICLNAYMSIHQLFGTNQEINGQVYSTDAHVVALMWGGKYYLWALLWLLGSLVATIVGMVFAPDTRHRNSSTRPMSSDTGAVKTPTNRASVPNNDDANASSTTPTDDTTTTEDTTTNEDTTTKPENPGSVGPPPFLEDTV